MKYKTVKLGTLISPAKNVRCGDKDYPVLSMTMHNGLVFQDEKFKKVIASKDTSNYKVVFRNQLVISFPIDEGVLAAQRIIDAGIVSPAYGIWNIDQKQVIPEFLENALRCKRAIDYYKAKLRGSTARRRSLPVPTLLDFNVPLPTIEEQNSILEIIHKTKQVIDNRQNVISKLDDLIKARFVEMFGTPLLNQKGWGVITAEECCNVITDGSHFSPQGQVEGYPMLSVKDMRNDGFHYESCKRVSEDDFQILKKQGCIPQVNDVLISKDGSYFYYGFVLSEYKDQAILSSIAMLRPDTQVVNPYYLCNYMLSERIVELVSENYVTGAALKRVILKGIKHIPVMVPPIESQNEFADFVKQVDKSKVAVKKALDEAQLLFDSLMQEYFG